MLELYSVHHRLLRAHTFLTASMSFLTALTLSKNPSMNVPPVAPPPFPPPPPPVPLPPPPSSLISIAISKGATPPPVSSPSLSFIFPSQARAAVAAALYFLLPRPSRVYTAGCWFCSERAAAHTNLTGTSKFTRRVNCDEGPEHNLPKFHFLSRWMGAGTLAQVLNGKSPRRLRGTMESISGYAAAGAAGWEAGTRIFRIFFVTSDKTHPAN